MLQDADDGLEPEPEPDRERGCDLMRWRICLTKRCASRSGARASGSGAAWRADEGPVPDAQRRAVSPAGAFPLPRAGETAGRPFFPERGLRSAAEGYSALSNHDAKQGARRLYDPRRLRKAEPPR